MLLWFFAGMVVYVAIVCVIAFEVILSAYLCYKSGWTESIDTGILVEFGSGIAHTSNPSKHFTLNRARTRTLTRHRPHL